MKTSLQVGHEEQFMITSKAPQGQKGLQKVPQFTCAGPEWNQQPVPGSSQRLTVMKCS